MAFNGVVTKAGFMNKTVTVTVSRWVIHKLTGKVSMKCHYYTGLSNVSQRIERSKKYLVHDEKNRMYLYHGPYIFLKRMVQNFARTISLLFATVLPYLP